MKYFFLPTEELIFLMQEETSDLNNEREENTIRLVAPKLRRISACNFLKRNGDN